MTPALFVGPSCPCHPSMAFAPAAHACVRPPRAGCHRCPLHPHHPRPLASGHSTSLLIVPAAAASSPVYRAIRWPMSLSEATPSSLAAAFLAARTCNPGLSAPVRSSFVARVTAGNDRKEPELVFSAPAPPNRFSHRNFHGFGCILACGRAYLKLLEEPSKEPPKKGLSGCMRV